MTLSSVCIGSVFSVSVSVVAYCYYYACGSGVSWRVVRLPSSECRVVLWCIGDRYIVVSTNALGGTRGPGCETIYTRVATTNHLHRNRNLQSTVIVIIDHVIVVHYHYVHIAHLIYHILS